MNSSLRFHVFTRDAFTCLYCNRRPPDVVLELEHVKPKSRGGSDETWNLVTSCIECNRGKATAELTELPQAVLVALIKDFGDNAAVTWFSRMAFAPRETLHAFPPDSPRHYGPLWSLQEFGLTMRQIGAAAEATAKHVKGSPEVGPEAAWQFFLGACAHSVGRYLTEGAPA